MRELIPNEWERSPFDGVTPEPVMKPSIAMTDAIWGREMKI